MPELPELPELPEMSDIIAGYGCGVPFAQMFSYVEKTAGGAARICVSVVGALLAPSLKDAPE